MLKLEKNNLKRVSPFVLNLKGQIPHQGFYINFILLEKLNNENNIKTQLKNLKKETHDLKQKHKELFLILTENIHNLLEHINMSKTEPVSNNLIEQNKLKEIKEIIDKEVEIFLSVSRNANVNHLILTEQLMSLVIRLDSIQCNDFIRLERKRAVKLAMGLLKILDYTSKNTSK